MNELCVLTTLYEWFMCLSGLSGALTSFKCDEIKQEKNFTKNIWSKEKQRSDFKIRTNIEMNVIEPDIVSLFKS